MHLLVVPLVFYLQNELIQNRSQFLRRKNELKEKLRDTYIIVDEEIFYLVSNNVNSIFEENTYSFVCSGYSKMMYDENGDNIIYKNDTGVKVISKKDYFAKLNKIIKQ